MRRFDVSNFMTKLLPFKTIAFDTNTLAPDVPILTHEYFKDHYVVGIVFIEISQPTGKNFKEMAVVGICIEREASRLDQSTNLTNRIEVQMRQKSKI